MHTPGVNNEYYGLRLLGTSAYTHREPAQSADVHIPICNSRWVAARAAFTGRFQVLSLDDERPSPLWKSAAIVPIHWTNVRHDRDILLVGVLTLNSNRAMVKERLIEDEARNGVDICTHLKPSMPGLLNTEERNVLRGCLETTATKLLTATRELGLFQ